MKTVPVEIKQNNTDEFIAISDIAIQYKQLKLVLRTKDKEIKELEKALLSAHAGMNVFTQGQQALTTVNSELAFQNGEKEKRAAELIVANKELAFQNAEKEKRAAELIVANTELIFQNGEKEKRAAELIVANKELAFQNEEKEKRAAELIIANKELFFQNREKERRAAELIIANKELAFQNEEKEKRAAELIVANTELTFQNGEKEKRAAELIVANKELLYQNGEKEKRAAELVLANRELEAFTYIASHDLKEPLRKIQTFVNRILSGDQQLTDSNKDYFQRMQVTANRMKQLIEDLLGYSHINATERKFEKTDIRDIIEEIKTDLKDIIAEKHAVIIATDICEMDIIPFQFRQLLYNLISNALKFASTERALHITIKSNVANGETFRHKELLPKRNYCHLSIADNGIGFDPQYKDRIFEVFQKLHVKEEFEGTGIGLAIVKKIIDNHEGFIFASGEINKGACFDIFIPVNA